MSAGDATTAHFASGLTALPTHARLSERVITVLGMNPGKMTLNGTNTYLIGTGRRRLLVDTGEGREEYAANLARVLEEEQCHIGAVILTHYHPDHVNGVASVLPMMPEPIVYKFPLANEVLPAPHAIDAYQPLADAQVISTDGATLQVVHTPGHTDDHVALLLREERAVLSGDCVLGAGTAVFTDLSRYMASLRRLLELEPARIYPGHGPTVEDACGKLREYIAHREQRERQVLGELIAAAAAGSSDDGDDAGALSPQQIVARLYTDVPATLHFAAARNVLLHLLKLEDEGRAAPARAVLRDGTESPESLIAVPWRATVSRL